MKTVGGTHFLFDRECRSKTAVHLAFFTYESVRFVCFRYISTVILIELPRLVIWVGMIHLAIRKEDVDFTKRPHESKNVNKYGSSIDKMDSIDYNR